MPYQIWDALDAWYRFISVHVCVYVTQCNRVRVYVCWLFGDMISFIEPIIILTNKFDAVISARTLYNRNVDFVE